MDKEELADRKRTLSVLNYIYNKLLTDKTRWTTEVYARDNDGIAVTSIDNQATCLCLKGAAIRATDCLFKEDMYSVPKLFKSQFIITFNDNPSTTFRHIRNWLRKQIKIYSAPPTKD